jgi:hypothetical protein
MRVEEVSEDGTITQRVYNPCPYFPPCILKNKAEFLTPEEETVRRHAQFRYLSKAEKRAFFGNGSQQQPPQQQQQQQQQ